jgi:hypothetical protein
MGLICIAKFDFIMEIHQSGYHSEQYITLIFITFLIILVINKRLSMQYLIKIIITALVVVGISELGKRYSAFAAILASLPLTSILAFIWLYWDTKDTTKVIELSYGIFWMVLPSLLFFIILPFLLKKGISFGMAMLYSSIIMAVFYTLYIYLLGKFGVKI